METEVPEGWMVASWEFRTFQRGRESAKGDWDPKGEFGDTKGEGGDTKWGVGDTKEEVWRYQRGSWGRDQRRDLATLNGGWGPKGGV